MIIRSNTPVLAAPRPRTVLRRVSQMPALTEVQDGYGQVVMPVAGVEGRAVGMGRSFAAQLLELGLKHNVEGLVNKASAAVEAQGQALGQSHPTANYELAQNNFAESPQLLRWRV